MTFHTRISQLNDILCTVNTLNWDARTQMPPGGAKSRGQQIATLMGLARDMILDPALKDVASVMTASASENERRAGDAVLEAIDHHTRVPAELVYARAEGSTLAAAAWAEARAKSDFSIFEPHLERIVDLARQQAQALGDYAHPYDPMVQIFEPGQTTASLTTFFDELRAGILPILTAARARPAPRVDFLYRDYPVEAQQRFARETARMLGYDYERGRLDTALHPFEVSFTRDDVRITSRWPRNYLPMSIFGTIHETGHALYEQNISPDFTRGAHATDMIGLYAVGGTSFGMHESQSRLMENHVGRSAAFWDVHYSRLRDTFPDQLADVSQEEWLAAINRVEPGPTRVESDELTYDLHIMLRVRIEMALMEGSLSVRDVPSVWNEAMQSDLGVKIESDAQGCLQDVHWSSGYIGSFPTYTVGNVTAAQLMARIEAKYPDTQSALGVGDPAPLCETLKQNIWRHGRSRSRVELLESMGANPGDIAPYLAHLRHRFAA